MRSALVCTLFAALGCAAEAPVGGSDVLAADVPSADISPPDSSPAGTTDGFEPPLEPPGVRHMDLTLDLSAHTGRAVLTLDPPAGGEVALATQGLTITAVAGADHALDSGVLYLALTDDANTVTVDYEWSEVPKGDFRGFMASGSTLLWPDHCGNLFPCAPHPADGLTFTLAVTGAPAGTTVVHPAHVAAPGPAYMVGLAVGEYAYTPVGTTEVGTEVGYWTLPKTAAAAAEGTEGLDAVVGWMETTVAPYPFGSPMGPVAVDWGLFAYGGFEAHPRWHVSTPAMKDLAVHAHEAAHGWFGNGVRLLCWEDLVLSEGVANYLAARSVGQAVDDARGEAIWESYRQRLEGLIAAGQDAVAWPATCRPDFHVVDDGLFSQIPYLKGSLFLRAVALEVGWEAVDQVLATFYALHAGGPARFQDLLDLIAQQTGFDPEVLAWEWLKAPGAPPR